MTSIIQGVILAGGESRRFGSPKAFAEKEGKPFYHYSISVLKPFVTSVLLITNPKLESLFKQREKDVEIVTDDKDYLGQGPLAGIYTAMKKVKADWYVVIPIDVPFMEQQVIEKLISNIDSDFEVIVPTLSGKIQPLISIYHCSMKDRIKEQLDSEKRAAHQLLKISEVKYVAMDKHKPFVNINNYTDYQRWIQKNS